MGILCSKLRKKSTKSLSATTRPTSAFTVPAVTNHPSFPLLQLPSLAIHEILKTMILLEIIQLSLVSEKTRRFVESFVKRSSSKNNNKLEVFIDDMELVMNLYCGESKPLVIEFEEWSRNADDSHLSESLIKFGDGSLHIEDDQNMYRIIAYWQSRDLAIKTMLQYIIRTFHPVITIEFQNFDEFLVSGTLNVMKQENANLDEISINSYITCSQVYQELLDLPIRKLTISDCPVVNFCNKPSDEPMKFEELEITKAHWVTELECFFYCKSIILKQIKVNEQDFKKFLKKWMQSNYPLKYANVEVQTLSWHVLTLKSIMEGLSATPMRRACMGEDFRDFQDGKCFGLQKSNGEKAIIYQSKGSIILQADSHLFS